MSVIALVWGLIFATMVQFGIYVLLALVVGAALFLIYKNIVAVKKGER